MKRVITFHPIYGRTINLSPPQILALSFLVMIFLGTILLSLPISQKNTISLMDAFFTSTSATTVTGLAVVDTGADLTVFGQVVLMVLMQFGGLGTMVFAILILMMFGRKIGLKGRILIQESLNQTSLGGLIRLVKALFLFTLVIESIGVIFLSIRWIPELGWSDGIYASVFHSISAFNNGGLSLWSNSMSSYVGDPIINIVITGLFITGGLGFTVLLDIWKKKQFHRLALHSKIMILGTLVINGMATILIFLLEYANPATIGSMPISDQLWGSYFQAVTTRTAGFNSINVGDMTTPSILLMMVLMFIGAGSASTASGIKVTTFIVLILATFTYLSGKDEAVIFNRTIKRQTILRGLAIVKVSLTLIFVAMFLLSITEHKPFLIIAFEVVSAFGTVGLSMGITSELSLFGKIVIMIMMFIGRVGPLTLAFIFAKQRKSSISYPEEEVFTG